MEDKSEYYKETSIKTMIFSYNIKKGRTKDKFTTDSNMLKYQDYRHHKLPITTNPLEYGKLIRQKDNEFFVQINETNVAIILQEANLNKVQLFRKGELVYEYIDRILESNIFRRTLDNKQFTFVNKELALLTINKKTKFIDNLKKGGKLNNKFITMDLETFVKDGVMTPYSISWYDGENSFSYYLIHYKNSEDMIKHAIKELMIRKYDNYQVYIHNLANFDGIFLLRILAELADIKPVIHNQTLISIALKFKGYNLTFKDSQQILIGSLKSLSKAFGVETQKSIFPYNFVNESRLNYNSWVPDFKYFDNIFKTEYLDYLELFKNKLWNLEMETIKYCVIDCISLYQILIKFNQLIFDIFKNNIHKYPTLSSLAFAIYRSNFFKNDTIPQLSGQIAKDIRMSYTGGAVDMYIPENPQNVKIYCYDVNGLYPYVMKTFDMPVGKPTIFYGDIRKIDPNAFGFFFCKIKAPDNLLHPILQTHIKTDGLTRTIAPLGQWNDMLFSAEMDNAKKIGYQFEILWGYKFERKNIFKEYVDRLYQFRLDYPKSHPLNYIGKLLLNSLYGKFGMIDQFPEIIIFDDTKSLKNFITNFSDDILGGIDLGNKTLIKYLSEDTKRSSMLYGNLETHNVNVAIASAITAYARIHMTQFKNNPNFILYYSDTDSAYLDRPLPDYMVSNTELGKMKLEHVLDKAIFLSPKVYFLITESGEHIYKVKGLKHDVELNLKDFEILLFKDYILQKLQTKWIRNLELGNISVIEQLYTLKTTKNKRQLIYNENNKLIGTVPYIINNKEIINKWCTLFWYLVYPLFIMLN